MRNHAMRDAEVQVEKRSKTTSSLRLSVGAERHLRLIQHRYAKEDAIKEIQ
jgi:hypothetical protein